MSPVRKKKGKAGSDKAATRKTARRPTGAPQTAARKSGPASQGSKPAAKPKRPDDKKTGSARRAPKELPKPAPPSTSGRRAPTVKSARPRSRKRSGGAAGATLFGSAPGPGGTHPRLGVKYECFECGAKFYDLKRPEPLCPRCGADQRARPKREAKPRPVEEAPRRPEPPPEPVTPLLEEDEEDTDVPDDEDLDLDLAETDEEFIEEEEVEEEDD